VICVIAVSPFLVTKLYQQIGSRIIPNP